MPLILPATLLLLAACAAAAPPPAMATCRSAPCIAIGEAQQFGIMRVTPLEVLADSRCPVDAQCVWAGELKVRARLDIGHETITVELSAGQPLAINGGALLLEEAVPLPSMQAPQQTPRDYRFHFTFAQSR